MKTNDNKAASEFLEGLKNLNVPAPPQSKGDSAAYAHITINRPVRCTIVFGPSHRADVRKPTDQD